MTTLAVPSLSSNYLDPSSRVERRHGNKGQKGGSDFSFGLVEPISSDRDQTAYDNPRPYTTHNAPVRRYSGWLSRANRLIGTLRLIDQELGGLEALPVTGEEDAKSYEETEAKSERLDNLEDVLQQNSAQVAQLLDDFVEEAEGFVDIESIGKLMRSSASIFSEDFVEAAQGVAKTRRFVQWTLQQLIDTMQDMISHRKDTLLEEDRLPEECASDTAEQISLSIDIGGDTAIEAQANLDPLLAVRLLAINEIRKH